MAGAVRAALRAAEVPYALAVARRNARFDRQRAKQRAAVPVISVGNITVGGTGKTPFVIEVVRRLTDMGRKPAVVARGYKAGKDGVNDEELLIRRRCPHAIYVADADRHRGCQQAVRQGADVVVLDDGFQHRRLARDLDIVLIDATCPFGYGHLLPRGLLREPVRSLRRADAVVITRADQVSAARLAEIRAEIQAATKPVPVLECRHRATEVFALDGRRLETAGLPVMLTAGIARPGAFETTVREMGADVVWTQWYGDHHCFSNRDLRDLLIDYDRSQAELLLTTEKDAVKIESLVGAAPSYAGRRHSHEPDKSPRKAYASMKAAGVQRLGLVMGVVRVGIDFHGKGSTMLRELLETLSTQDAV